VAVTVCTRYDGWSTRGTGTGLTLASRALASIHFGTAFSVLFLRLSPLGLGNEPICKLFRIVTCDQVFADWLNIHRRLPGISDRVHYSVPSCQQMRTRARGRYRQSGSKFRGPVVGAAGPNLRLRVASNTFNFIVFNHRVAYVDEEPRAEMYGACSTDRICIIVVSQLSMRASATVQDCELGVLEVGQT
jgi:hypothetical protein